MSSPLTASLRVRMSQADAHYGGGLVAGGRLMELLGDVATELCVRHDGDEGLFAGYSSVKFVAPVSAGDFLEVRGTIIRSSQTAREMDFEILRYAQPRPDLSDSAVDILDQPETVLTARGTCVVKKDRQRR